MGERPVPGRTLSRRVLLSYMMCYKLDLTGLVQFVEHLQQDNVRYLTAL